MNTEFGAFALRQILASTAVVGPILILIGLCYYLFKQDKRSVMGVHPGRRVFHLDWIRMPLS